ncbi:hypothetical protein HYV84_00880 [Candidatus Woesearchaeota archaeon]|nr:hypothetical protein [Candidatus Woesearchaeota archaeon]
MKKKEKEDGIFVGVKDPLRVRKDILESSRDVLEGLKSYESFKQVREEKRMLFEQLRSDARSISLLIGRLRGELPQLKVPAAKVEKAKEQPQPKQGKMVPAVEKAKPATEVQRLEEELAQLEEAVQKMGG